jgi:hypothetical protein
MPCNLVDRYQHSVGICFFLLLGTEDGAAGSFKYWYIWTKIHGITSQKTATLIITDLKNSDLSKVKFDNGTQTSLLTIKLRPAPSRGVTRTGYERVHLEPCSPIRLHSLVIRHRGDLALRDERSVNDEESGGSDVTYS